MAVTAPDLNAILTALLAAQAQLDELGEALAAARLDAVIEAVNVALISGGASNLSLK